MQDAYAEVATVLSTYFDGLYHSDTKRLTSVFHPRAQYVCATEGMLTYRTMEEYFPIVDARPSPASRGEERADNIVSIEFAGPVTAVARVNCAIGAKYFTDLLTLVRLDGRWQIISKVFHFEIREAQSGSPSQTR
jgi:Putative lumazine-binding